LTTRDRKQTRDKVVHLLSDGIQIVR